MNKFLVSLPDYNEGVMPVPSYHHPTLLHWLRLALQRLDTRVLALMVDHPGVALGLSRLASRGQLTAAHTHITRYLPPEGARLTDLARAAGMTKQAMAALVNECEIWGMVERVADGRDARARIIRFTALGQGWLQAYHAALAQAEAEFRVAVGEDVATVVVLGLEAFCA
jgi:DNA-binding MarR family transcriptional regulator